MRHTHRVLEPEERFLQTRTPPILPIVGIKASSTPLLVLFLLPSNSLTRRSARGCLTEPKLRHICEAVFRRHFRSSPVQIHPSPRGMQRHEVPTIRELLPHPETKNYWEQQPAPGETIRRGGLDETSVMEEE